MKRPAINERMKVDRFLGYGFVTCAICKVLLHAGDAIDWDHRLPIAMGGDHIWSNIRPVHRECHKLKTFGTKATSYGSDIHAIAKTKRLANGGKKVKRPMPKSQRKMQSRGFR